MSTDLTEKFTALETQLSTQHDAVMTAIGAIDTKLSTIAGRLVFDNDEQVFTLSQLAYLCLLQLQEIKYSNDSIVTRLTAIDNSTANTDGNIEDIRGLTIAIRDNTSATATALGVPGDGIADALHTLDSIKAGIEILNDRLGIPGDATDTVIDHLRAIERCGCAPDGAQPPVNAPCEAPQASSGIVLIPFGLFFGASVNVATWSDPPPVGTHFETFFALTDDTSEIAPNTDWEGYQIFVSSAAQVFALSPLDITRYPTNTWLALHGSDSISVATDERNGLKVYLCSGAPLPEDCFEIVSVPVTAPWGGTFEGIDWTGSGFANTNTGPTGTFSANIFSTSDLTEWRVTTDDTDVHMNMSGNDDPTDFQILEVGVEATIVGPTPYLHFYRPAGTFTITICPPEV